MTGFFELSKSSDGQFRFTLKAEKSETLLSSELYQEKRSAEKGIASVQENCTVEDRYERKVASNGKFFFNLKAANHQVIGTSPLYATADERDAGISSVKSTGQAATVQDKT
jgi:uncharacterized protein YegP (UPF0339 family)